MGPRAPATRRAAAPASMMMRVAVCSGAPAAAASTLAVLCGAERPCRTLRWSCAHCQERAALCQDVRETLATGQATCGSGTPQTGAVACCCGTRTHASWVEDSKALHCFWASHQKAMLLRACTGTGRRRTGGARCGRCGCGTGRLIAVEGSAAREPRRHTDRPVRPLDQMQTAGPVGSDADGGAGSALGRVRDARGGACVWPSPGQETP